jgi:hypothetical protein
MASSVVRFKGAHHHGGRRARADCVVPSISANEQLRVVLKGSMTLRSAANAAAAAGDTYNIPTMSRTR